MPYVWRCQISYNGSGTFNINTAGQPVVTGTVISSTAFNALTSDLGTGLSTAITKDGQTTATARIPFAAGINSSLVTDATSTTTGSIITAGGVGIAKALYVGTTLNVAGASTLAAITGTFNGTVGATTPSTGAFTTVTASAGSGVRAVLVSGGSIASFYDSSAVEQGRIQASTSALFLSTVTTNPININVNSTTVGTFNAYGLGLGTAVPSSGIGLSFPATQSASTDPNTLDDYEEGTWTPGQGSGLTITGTYASSGIYTKIGNFVYVKGVITATTIAVGAGSQFCTGMPFSSSGVSVTGGLTNSLLMSSTNLWTSGTTLNAAEALTVGNTGYFSATYSV